VKSSKRLRVFQAAWKSISRWKEQGGGAKIPEVTGKPDFIHPKDVSNKGMPGLYRLELQVT
jgi:predicted ATP-dependent Lon-type protease